MNSSLRELYLWIRVLSGRNLFENVFPRSEHRRQFRVERKSAVQIVS